MERSEGIKKLLKNSLIYSKTQEIIKIFGFKNIERWFVEDICQVRSGEKVVDLGCGTCEILECMPNDVDYCGVDISENYISTARKKYGDRGRFFCQSSNGISNGDLADLGGSDLVFAFGLLHHLSDDEIKDTIKVAKSLLKEQGRLVFFEPCFLLRQGRISKFLMKQDRGKNIKTEEKWRKIMTENELDIKTSIVTGMTAIPWIHIIIRA